jgi:hypothetical protein
MKLRQKLAVVLAATMFVTAVPVVTMAKTSADITAGSTLVGVVGEKLTQSVTLELECKNAISSDDVFYITLEGAVFTSDIADKLTEGNATVTSTGKYEIEVTPDADLEPGDIISLTFEAGAIKMTGSEAKFVIDGGSTGISSEKVTFAKTSTAKATVEVTSDVPVIYTGTNTVANITIKEPYAGAFEVGDVIKLQLRNSGFEIIDADLTARTLDAEINEDSLEDGVIEIEITEASTTSAGRILLSDIQVKSTTKSPKEGNLNIKVSGDCLTTAEYTVAEISEHNVALTATKVVDITAGKTEQVKFKLVENLEDSIVRNRDIDFELNQGFFTKDSLDAADLEYSSSDAVKVSGTIVGYTAFTYKETASEKVSEEFALDVVTKLTHSGDITVTASGSRSIGEDLTVVVATVEAPVTVETENVVLKAGLKGQVGGKIVITETEGGNIEKGNLVIELDGVTFDDVPTIEVVEGDLELNLKSAKLDDDNAKLIIPVKSTSYEASTIEISELPITTSRAIPEGTWDAYVTLEADDAEITTAGFEGNNYYGTITLEDFIKVATLNTEDISNTTTGTIKKGVASFVVGSSTYTLNGEEVVMDAAAYAKDGRVYAPVRYVAQAFGIEGADIIVSGNNITLLAGNRTIQLTVGSNVAKLNGVDIVMDGVVEVINGRSYAPLSQVGNLLGVTPSWDGATQTATFTSK